MAAEVARTERAELAGSLPLVPDRVGFGHIQTWRRGDGTVGLGDADPLVAVSLALFAEQADPRFLFVRDGLVVFAGYGPDDQPREVRYQAVGLHVSDPAGLAANEGGFVLLERVA